MANKEEEKTIGEIIDRMIKSYIEADECGLSNNDFKHEIKAMQTVLNMLKEKDKEIELYKKKNTELSNQMLMLYKEQDNYNARIEKKNAEIEKYKYLYQKALDNTIEADKENIQLKKQIDLMAEDWFSKEGYKLQIYTQRNRTDDRIFRKKRIYNQSI